MNSAAEMSTPEMPWSLMPIALRCRIHSDRATSLLDCIAQTRAQHMAAKVEGQTGIQPSSNHTCGWKKHTAVIAHVVHGLLVTPSTCWQSSNISLLNYASILSTNVIWVTSWACWAGDWTRHPLWEVQAYGELGAIDSLIRWKQQPLMPWHWESGEFDVCKCPNQATVKQAAQGPHDHRFHLTPVNPVNAMLNTMVILVANNALQCTSFYLLDFLHCCLHYHLQMHQRNASA